jgi:hypothetical protein
MDEVQPVATRPTEDRLHPLCIRGPTHPHIDASPHHLVVDHLQHVDMPLVGRSEGELPARVGVTVMETEGPGTAGGRCWSGVGQREVGLAGHSGQCGGDGLQVGFLM